MSIPSVPATFTIVIDAFHFSGTQAVTFAIPSGHYTGGTWACTGNYTAGGPIGSKPFNILTPAGATHGANFGSGGSPFNTTAAVTSDQLTDINAAAGGNLNAVWSMTASDCTVNVTSLTLTLTPCAYSINPTSATYGVDGGSGTFDLTTTSGCPWTAVSNDTWIHVTGGSSGTGNGTVSYSVDARYAVGSRTGTITAGGQTFTVTQTGCTYAIDPSSASYSAAGGSGTFALTTQSVCPWSVFSNNSWLTVTSAGTGTGNTTVHYSVAVNPSGSCARIGTISAGGQTFTVTQAGYQGGAVVFQSRPFPHTNAAQQIAQVSWPCGYFAGGANIADVLGNMGTTYDVAKVRGAYTAVISGTNVLLYDANGVEVVDGTSVPTVDVWRFRYGG